MFLNNSFNKSRLVMLPFINSIFLLSIKSWIFLRYPVDRLSIIVTLFSFDKLLARFEPMNPAPPVTIIFLFLIIKST